MKSTTENDILFDDITLLEARLGKHYLRTTSENLSPDCNCGAAPINDEVTAKYEEQQIL